MFKKKPQEKQKEDVKIDAIAEKWVNILFAQLDFNLRQKRQDKNERLYNNPQ